MRNFNRDAAAGTDCTGQQSSIMNTVQRQIESYQQSLETVRQLRAEYDANPDLHQRLGSSPESMATVLVERGVPIFLAVSMAGEDYVDPNFGTALAIWTWNCCCSDCCITSISITNSYNSVARAPIDLNACFGRRLDGQQ